MSKELHRCPICSEKLSGYDRRLRKVISDDGSETLYKIRRLKCKGCGKLHNELPDFVHPYKHYESEVIEAQLDGTRTDCPAENSTVHRWLSSFKNNRECLESAFRTLWIREKQKHYPILQKNSLLDYIKSKGQGWLTTVTQLLINNNLRLPTQFAW